MKNRLHPFHVPELQIVLGVAAFLLLSWPLIGDVADHAGGVVSWLFGAWALVIAGLVAVQAKAVVHGSSARRDHADEDEPGV